MNNFISKTVAMISAALLLPSIGITGIEASKAHGGSAVWFFGVIVFQAFLFSNVITYIALSKKQ